MKKAFNKENRKLTISLIILLMTTTLCYILSYLGLFITTKMNWYQTVIGIIDLLASYTFFYELGKHKKNETEQN